MLTMSIEHTIGPEFSFLSLYMNLNINNYSLASTQLATAEIYSDKTNDDVQRMIDKFCATLTREAPAAANLARGSDELKLHNEGGLPLPITSQTRKSYIDG
jgi:hypothetical protein